MSELERVKQHNNLYSMGLLPKIQGRYLTGPKPNPKLKLAISKRSDFSMEHIKMRLNMQLKRIQVSQRIMDRSQRNRNRSLCRTEPIEHHPIVETNTIHIKSIDMSVPERASQLKQSISLARRQPTLRISIQQSEVNSQSIQVSKIHSGSHKSNSPTVLKAKFGKRSIEEDHVEERGRAPPEGGQTIGQWVQTIQKTYNHFHLYSQERLHEDHIYEKGEDDQQQMHHTKFKFKKYEKSKRQFLFKSDHFTQHS